MEKQAARRLFPKRSARAGSLAVSRKRRPEEISLASSGAGGENRSMESILSVRGLRVQRGDAVILRKIDWQVEPGQHWAILGANGSGKTSLLAALTGYLTPTAGEIHLLGETFGEANWPELRARVGFVSSIIAQRVPGEETALETVMSGIAAQLGYWTRDSRRERDARAVTGQRCLARMGATSLAAKPWRVLSQGERQKVFIARALMADPALLILDEPCAGLDPVARQTFLASVSKLAKARKAPTLVFVTHHVEEITPEFSHTLILRKGRVLAQGLTHEVLSGAHLSKAFGAPLVLDTDKFGRYRLSQA